ncbi:MAG: DUF2442 domain-containing protein [Candidatus Kapabacteria bacterium]|nr:DUF2442 domain-containing protein [Candidatus Kapabacteria bacterium]
MYPKVIEVECLDNFLVKLKFDTKEVKLFDIKPYLEKGIFRELKNPIIFKSAHIAIDTLEFSNGVDFDPELLYAKGIPL